MDMIATGVNLPDSPEKKPTTDQPTAVIAAALPKPAAPVMDVKPPVADNAVHAAPPEEKTADTTEPKADKKSKKTKAPKVTKPKTPRQPGSGGAIFASVVIVLGLAALAVYAYLKSVNIPVS